jgi:hypothetical protein
MTTPVSNFGLVTVSGAYDASAVTVALQTGDGSRLPETFGGYTYPLTWWNATDYAHPALDPNKEIVLVTDRSTDALTITRAQEGTSASTKNISGKTYYLSLGITKSMWESLRTPTQWFQGLQLQTHRDSDLSHKEVELVDVDSIIMDDGTELRNDNGEWSGKVADITVSGAGGLDSGTEVTAQWFEIHAIAKEDGTRNLVLHQSKIWFSSASNLGGDDASQGIRSAVDNSTVKVAQGFTISDSGPAVYVAAQLLKVGAPTGKIWFTLETNNAGHPSGTVVATSSAYDVARLSTTAQMVRFSVTSSQVLSTSTQYHLVVQGSWTVSATHYVAWRMDGSASTYANGAKALFDSDTSVWITDPDDDMIFEVGIETGNSALSLPTGYTKQCFLGWVFNDAAGNFINFMQVDRTRRDAVLTQNNNLVVVLSGSAEFHDAWFVIPPRRLLKVVMALTGTGTSAAVAAIGDLRATDISTAGDTIGAQAILYAGSTTARPSEFQEVLVQSGGIMVMGTATAKLWVSGFSW